MLAFLEQGLTFFWIGLLVATRSLTINLLEIPSGAIADTWGRRRSMILSFSAYIVSFVTLAFAGSVAWFMIAMVLYGIGDSFRTGTHKAMIFEWLRIHGRTNEKTKVYGTTRSWSKFGSALSAILAAVFVVISGNYRSIFLFATIPYVMNIINFLGYPPELDGQSDAENDGLDGEATSRQGIIGQSWQTLRTALSESFRNSSLRRLVFESMSWEGVFHAVKDYIQPVLAAVVVGWIAANQFGEQFDFNEQQTTAIAIGAIYTILFLFSGFASRGAYRFVAWSGDEQQAARRLWLVNGLVYIALAWLAWQGVLWGVVLMFVVMHVLQNVWRPILISRFDEHTQAKKGATVLSIESGAQRLSTLIVAPWLGFWIDHLTVTTDTGQAVAQMGSQYWPIGVVGAIAAAGMWFTAVKKSV